MPTFHIAGAAMATNAQAYVLLKASSLLGGLSETVLQGLAHKTQVVRYDKGETVFHRGDAGDYMLIVISGRLKAFNITADAREIVLNFIAKDDVLGEIALLDGRERTANTVALEPVEALILYRRDLWPVLSANNEALVEIIGVLSGKLRAASAIVEENTLPMASCMAAGLLRLAEQHGRKTRDGIVIDLKLPQRDLGAYLGLSRENANRQLSTFREAGYCSMDGGRIVILDDGALKVIAESVAD
jgi:CRP/FNR family cyclic AMP-dependent transcriptional regulator